MSLVGFLKWILERGHSCESDLLMRAAKRKIKEVEHSRGQKLVSKGDSWLETGFSLVLHWALVHELHYRVSLHLKRAFCPPPPLVTGPGPRRWG